MKKAITTYAVIMIYALALTTPSFAQDAKADKNKDKVVIEDMKSANVIMQGEIKEFEQSAGGNLIDE